MAAMIRGFSWLRDAAAAALFASVGTLALEAIRPGTVGSTLPLALPVSAAVLASVAIAALPPRPAPPLRAWQMLAFGWVAATAGLAVAAVLRHSTEYALPLGALAAAAVWGACAALWLRAPGR